MSERDLVTLHAYELTLSAAAIWIAKVAYVRGLYPSNIACRWVTSYGLKIHIESESRDLAQALCNRSLDTHQVFSSKNEALERNYPLAARLYSSIGRIIRDGLFQVTIHNWMAICELPECRNAQSKVPEICTMIKKRWVCQDCVAEIEHEERCKRQQRSLVGPKLRYEVLARDRFACRTCGSPARPEANITLNVDHIIPVAEGGKTVMTNLQTLCSECNLGKGATLAQVRDQLGHQDIKTTSIYLHGTERTQMIRDLPIK